MNTYPQQQPYPNPPMQYGYQTPQVYGQMMQQPYGGYMGQAVQQQPTMVQYLSPEQMQELQLAPELFPTKLTRDEYLRAICTHKKDNTIVLKDLPDGRHHCVICQADFALFDPDTPEETIQRVCQNTHDLLQSIKTYLLNAPEALKDIYLMLGFIQKLPLLWKSAVKSFEQASSQGLPGVSQFGHNMMQDNNAFSMLGNIFGSNVIPGYNGYYQQPAPVPPMAMYSQPGFGQMPTAPLPQAPIQNQYANQQYGFVQQPQWNQPAPQTQQYPAPPPPGYTPNPGSNPIGYVEQTPMATQNVQMGGAQPPVQAQVMNNPNVAPPPPPTPTADKK